MLRNSVAILLALAALTSNAQFEYKSEKPFEGKGLIQIIPHPKHSIGMKAIHKTFSMGREAQLSFESSIEKAQTSGADFWVIETVKEFEGKREHYLSFGRPSSEYELRTNERPYFIPAREFEILAELRVDSVLMSDDTMQEIYVKSLLQYIMDGQKRNDEELVNYYKTAFYIENPTTFYFRQQDLDKTFQLEGALQRAFPEAQMIKAEKRAELIPSEVWKEERSVLFLISEVTVGGKRFALKQLFSLQRGLLYAERRALDTKETAIAVAEDISPLRYKPLEKEIREIKSGAWSGPKKKGQ